MKITQEMIDDWSSNPDGYSDFRFGAQHKNEYYNYQGGIAVVRGDQYAIEARGGGYRGKLKLIPIWVYGREDGIIDMLECPILPEPEFSLDEIALGEELIRG